MKVFLSICCLLCACVLRAQDPIELELFATGLSSPVDIEHAGDDRLFVVERRGRIRIVTADGSVLPQSYLDIDGRTVSGGEQGLLGLVFHPDYATNGYFYVNYTANGGDTRISRFSVSPEDPNLADANSEVILMTIEQPFSNHNAGDLNFGPDGYLYIGTGDGGAGGDPGNRSQDPQDLLGKMLRIDVDNGDPYAIPADNPFVDDPNTLDEIWAIGLRNPWRFSFDRATGDMYIADVGQNEWEEIDFQPASSTGGENYGWRCYEGFEPFNLSGCSGTYVDPIHVYANTFSVGCSVTGGYVYRGSQYPDLVGKYIYADFCTGRFWHLERIGEEWVNTDLVNLTNQEYSSFGEDVSGELYVAGLGSGRIFRLVGSCVAADVSSVVIRPTCAGDTDGSIDLTINGGTPPYQFNWSNGTDTEDLNAIAAGMYSLTITDETGCETVEIIEVDEPDPVVTEVSVDDNIIMVTSEFTSYQWYLNGTPIDNATASSYTVTENGDYYVEVSTVDGCVGVSDIISIVVSSITELTAVEDFRVTPNPFKDQLLVNITTNRRARMEVRLLNLAGQEIQKETIVVNGTEQLEFPTERLAPGIYLIEVLHRGERGSQKVVKQ